MFPGWRRALGLAAVLAVLAACSRDKPPPVQHSSGHSSPASIPPAVMPPGTFDQDRAADELARARSAHAAGSLAQARTQAEQALAHWPASVESWSELQAICQAQDDEECTRYATFFLAKLDFVATLPAHVAMLGFQNIAETPPSSADSAPSPVGGKADKAAGKGDTQNIDPRTRAMARRLEAFYNLQGHNAADPSLSDLDAPQQP